MSKRHPDSGGIQHRDSARIEAAIAQYQSSRDAGSLGEIIKLTENRALALIRFYRTTRYRSKDELMSDVNFKLLKAVGKFDPTKSTAFTFVSQVIANALCTSVSNARRDTARYKKLTRPILAQLTDKTEDRAGVDDITHRMRASVRTTLTDAVEFRKK